MGLDMKYFVLKPKSKSANDPYARASRKAMETYAREIRDTDIELARDLFTWILSEEIADEELQKEPEKLIYYGPATSY